MPNNKSTKRMYIAVGSSSVKSLIAIITRAMDENIYHNNNTYYLGLDSDESKLKELKSLDAERSKIDGILIKGSDQDKEASFVRNFQPAWKALDIPHIGVGGDSRLSFTSLNWRDDISLERMLAKLDDSNDELILIGSAFGGTSTGLFWNVANYMQKQLNNKAKNGKTPVSFYSILILPEPPGSTKRGKEYPLGRNLCSFFKEAQSHEWGIRLAKFGHMPFKMPMYALSGDDSVSLWNEEEHGSSIKSGLPMEEIFIVPTNLQKRNHVYECVAELAHLLGYLGLWKKLPSDSADKRLEQLNKEDCVFGGVNMLVAKNSRNLILKKSYYQLFKKRYDAFMNHTATDADNIFYSLSSCLDKMIIGDKKKFESQEQHIRTIVFESKLDELNNILSQELNEIKKKLKDAPFDWPSFPDFLRNVLLAIGDDRSKQDELMLDALCKTYNGKIIEIQDKAKTINEITLTMTEMVKKALRIRTKRKNSFTASLFGCKESLQTEIEMELKKALNLLLNEYIYSCRCQRTLNKLPQAIQINDERHGAREKNYEKVTNFIENRINMSDSLSADFIHENTDNDLSVDLDVLLPDNSTFDEVQLDFSATILKAILSKSESDLKDSLESFERKQIRELGKLAEQKGEANPFRNIKCSFDLNKLQKGQGKPFHRAFAFPETETFTDGFTYPFYYQRGQAEDLSWRNVTSDLGFTSFKSLLPEGARETDTFSPEKLKEPMCLEISQDATTGIGVFLGSLGAAFNIKDILSNVFHGSMLHDWSIAVVKDEESFGGVSPRLMTLNEFCYMGVFLGVLENIVNDKVESEFFNGVLLNIKVKNSQGSDNHEIIKYENIEINKYFSYMNNKLTMISVPLDWIEPIMTWLRGSFEADMKINGNGGLAQKLKIEQSILTTIQMKIPEGIQKDLSSLATCIKSLIDVTAVQQ